MWRPALAKSPNSAVTVTDDVRAKIHLGEPALTWSWEHRREVKWSRKEAESKTGKEEEEEEVNILRGESAKRKCSGSQYWLSHFRYRGKPSAS